MAVRGKRSAKKGIFNLGDLKKDLKEEIKKELLSELGGRLYVREYYKIEEKPKETFSKEELHEEPSEVFERQSVGFEVKKPMDKSVKTLIFLVAIVLIIDFIVLVFYVNPNVLQDIKKNTGSAISGIGNLGNHKCSDGTAYDSCSSTKPMYCYQGQLVAKAASCGCPAGYKLNFQDCVKINSS